MEDDPHFLPGPMIGMALRAAAPHGAALLHPPPFSPPFSSSCSLPPAPAFRPLPISHGAQCQSPHKPLRIVARATSSGGSDVLDDLAARLVERAGDAARLVSARAGQFLRCAGQTAVDLEKGLDLQAKLLQVLHVANLKAEELAYDAMKRAEKWDRRFRISGKAQRLAGFAREKFRSVDDRFAIRQNLRNVSLDLHRNWPMYNRRFNQFCQTPLGKTLSTLFLLWLLLSGWLFRIIFLSTWILPLAAPFIINTVARNAIVEGACPSCKRRFIGNRSQVIFCNYCRAVVWQPRQDFSRDDSDPRIIDIDADYR